MREMNEPVSWLEAGWLSLPSAEAPVGVARVNLFRRRHRVRDDRHRASDSGGAAPDSHRLPKLHGPLISLQLSHEAYHRTGVRRKAAVWTCVSRTPRRHWPND